MHDPDEWQQTRNDDAITDGPDLGAYCSGDFDNADGVEATVWEWF